MLPNFPPKIFETPSYMSKKGKIGKTILGAKRQDFASSYKKNPPAPIIVLNQCSPLDIQ